MIPGWLNAFNSLAWIGSNLLVLYVAVILVVFVVFYFILFDPRATTAGRFVYRFIVSLVGVIGLAFISSYVDPQTGRAWFQYPGDVIFWRPIVRFIVYAYVAYSVTALQVLIIIRKWWPHKLRTALDREILKTRKADHDLQDTLIDKSSEELL